MILWVIEICQTKGKLTRKAALILGLLVFLVYVASSSLFRDKIDGFLRGFPGQTMHPSSRPGAQIFGRYT